MFFWFIFFSSLEFTLSTSLRLSFIFVFGDKVSHVMLVRLELTMYVDKVGLILPEMYLPLSPECWT